MKKLKSICSAIAAFCVLALAGCDLDIPESDKVELYSSGFNVNVNLPQTITKAGFDMTIDALTEFEKSDGSAWTEADGVSFSFYLSGYTNDWSMIFQVPSGNFGTTTAHQCTNSVWVANAFGCAPENGTYDEFFEDSYVTISITNDGYMKFYKNGSLVTTYGGSTAPYGFATCEFSIGADQWIKNIISDIASTGVTCIHPTDSWANASASEYTMKSFTLDVAVDDDGALEKYNTYKASVAE